MKEEGDDDEEWDEGCFVDALSLRSSDSVVEVGGEVHARRMQKMKDCGAGRCMLLEMPDEMWVLSVSSSPDPFIIPTS